MIEQANGTQKHKCKQIHIHTKKRGDRKETCMVEQANSALDSANTLQHIATHCNTLQHTVTHYNTL